MKKQQNVQKPLKRLLSLLLVVVLLAGQMGGALSALAWDTGDGEEGEISPADLDDDGGTGNNSDDSNDGGDTDDGSDDDTSSTVTFTLSSDSKYVTLSDGADSVTADANGYYTVTLTAADYYVLPEQITASVNETVVDSRYTQSTGLVEIPATAVSNGDTVTIEATVKEASYTVTLHPDGATIEAEDDWTNHDDGTYTYTVTGTAAASALTLPTITKTGYNAGEWYSDSTFTSNAVTSVTFDPSVYTYDYYAKWTKTVTFDANGGTFTDGTTATATGTDSETITTPSVSKSGSALSGWANSSGTALPATFANVTNGATYYAQWEEVTVTFEEGGLSKVTMSTSDNTVTLTPEDHYSVDTSSISITDGNGNTINSYSVELDEDSGVATITLTSDYVSSLNDDVTLTVSASATEKSYNLIFTDSGYTVSVGDTTSGSAPVTITDAVTYGTNATITITPKNGYTVDTSKATVSVNGDTLSNEQAYWNDYTLTIVGSAITGDVTVKVGTTLNSTNAYTVTEVTISDTYTVASGDSYNYSTYNEDYATLTNSCVLIAPKDPATGVVYNDTTYAGIIIGTVDGVTNGDTVSDGTNTYYVLGDVEGSVTFALADSYGTTSDEVTIYVNEDTTDPAVKIAATSGTVTVSDTVYTNGEATYTLTASDDNLENVVITVAKDGESIGSLTYTYRNNGNGWSKQNPNDQINNVSGSVDGSNSSTTAFTATLTLSDALDEGTYTITLSATDKAGNPTDESSDTATVIVDKTAPTVESETFTVTTTDENNESTTTNLTTGDNDYYTVTGDFTYSVTLTDEVSGVNTDAEIKAILIDFEGNEVSTWSPSLSTNDDTVTLTISVSPKTLGLEDEETYQIEITGIADNAGNKYTTTTGTGWSATTVEAYYSASFLYEKGIPNATVTVQATGEDTNTYTDPSGNLYYNGNVEVTLTVETGTSVAWTETETSGYYTSNQVTLTITDKDGADVTSKVASFTGFEIVEDEDSKTDTHTATFTLSASANKYTITLTVEDDSSTSENKEDTKVVIFDTEYPTATVKIDRTETTDMTTTWAQSHTVAVTFEDPAVADGVAGSGVNTSTIVYYIEASDDYSTANLTGIEVGSESSPIAYTSGDELTIAANDDATFEGTLYIVATDNVGNVKTVEIPLALDADAPDVTVGAPYYAADSEDEDSENTYLTAADDGTYYANQEVTYDLSVTDVELASVTVTVTNPDASEEDGATIFTQTFTWNSEDKEWTTDKTESEIVSIEANNTSADEWTATLTIEAGDETTTYMVAVTAEDSSGNDGSDSSTLVMDVEEPDADVTYQGSKNGKFFSTNLEYALTAADESLLDTVVVTVTAGDNTYTLTYTYSKENGWEKTTSGSLNFVTVDVKENQNNGSKSWNATLTISAWGDVDSTDFRVEIVSTNKAGNSSDDTEEQAIDNVAPVVGVDTPTGYTGTVTIEGEGDENDVTVYYSNTDVIYSLTASDTNLDKIVVTVTEDGDEITYTYSVTNEDTGEGEWVTTDTSPDAVTIDVSGDSTATDWSATLTIKATEKTAADTYVVTVKAYDKAEPANEGNDTSDTLIIDTVDPVPTITGPNDYNGEDYYSSTNVTYDLTVVDENLDEELITVLVNDVDVSELADVTLGTWQQDGNTWTNTVTIAASENVASTDYTVTLTAKDYAGNEPTEPTISDTVVIDTVDPVATVGTPSGTDGYEDSVYYAGAGSEVTYSLTATDANLNNEIIVVTDGNDKTLFYYDTLGDDSLTQGNISLTIHTSNVSAWTATLTITAQDGVDTSNYQVYLLAQDKAYNYDDDTSEFLVIDTVAPTVTYTGYSGNVYASDYYANTTGKVSNSGDSTYYVFAASATTDLHVTVTVTDANIDMTGKQITVTRYSSLANAESQTGGSVDYVPTDWSSSADGTTWTQTVTIPANAQEGYYVLTLTATDKAANAYDTDSVGENTGATDNVLVNDTTAPTVTASVTNPTNIGSYGGKNVYYVTASGNLAVTFSISDNNDLLTNANGDNSSYSFTLYKYASASSASVVTVPASAGNFSGWSGSATSKTGTYTLDRSALGLSDGIYAVELTVTDQAGNSTTYLSDYLVIDTTAPTGQIEAGGSGFSGFWQNLLSTITFGLYSNDGINYTLSWDDNSDSFLNSSEGVKSVKYAIYDLASGSQAYTTASALAAATDVTWQSVSNVSADSTSASVGNDDKFVIYLCIEDMAGNVTYISSDGLITENDPSQINSDTTDPEILVTVANENGNTSGVHDSSVSLGVEIVEYPNITFSGIDQSTIAYTISDGYDGTVRLSTTDGSGMTFSTNSDGLKGSGNQTVVVSVPEGYESDQIYLTATVTDNAGNAKTVEYTALNVDNRTPTATVTYDNNTSYNDYYFNSARVATIVIQEMNFDASNTQVTTEGSLSGWTTTGTGSETTNTATVTYNQDGDYTITIQSTDLAGHTMTDGDVVYEGVATQRFTIDMTAPTVSVTFTDASGNTVPSGGYANSTVTATITVVEHNFDASSATSGIHITRDGETYTPSISWSNNGDVHTAVITFTEEEGAYYTFDISFVDLANNQSAAFSTQSFYVDTMAPEIVVDNISNNSANNAAVIAPVITITDKYYDEANVTVTLTGAKTGVVANAYTVEDIENGQRFIFNNIEDDDIYTITVTVTDLAGNVVETMYVTDSEESTDNLTFSVNRNGSTYQVDEDTAALLESYYVSSIDDDVVIEIINVDPIEDIVITVTRGLLRSWDLTEGEDYTIVEEEITGGYRYTITIFKEVFDEDGAYSISIYTEDAAGNTSTNNTANDDQAIQLDFYLDSEGPIIVLNDLDKNGRYNYSAYDEASVSVTDATLEEITVDIIYQDGTGTKTYTWGEEEIYAEDFTGTFIATLDEEKAIAESTSQIRIEISARDKAGNVAYGPVDEETNEVDDNYYFTVSTNPFVRFFANKPLFYGTIAALILIILLIILLIVLRRKKSEEEETGETVQEDTKGKEKAEK